MPSPLLVLPVLVVGNWLAIVEAARIAAHRGWLFYDGGDGTWYYTSAWVLGHGHIPDAAIGYDYSLLIAPLTLIAGPNPLAGLPLIVVLLNALVLSPIALLCVYGLAKAIGGLRFAYATALVWVVAPLLAIRYFLPDYHTRYVDVALPAAVGLTAGGDFPSMVCLLVAALLRLPRARVGLDRDDALATGLATGIAIGVKPSNALFLPAVLVALALTRRPRQLALLGAGLAPSLLALALWKYRGLGDLPVPLLAAGGARCGCRWRGSARVLPRPPRELPPLRLDELPAQPRRLPRVGLEQTPDRVDHRRSDRARPALALRGAADRRLVRRLPAASREATRSSRSRQATSSPTHDPGRPRVRHPRELRRVLHPGVRPPSASGAGGDELATQRTLPAARARAACLPRRRADRRVRNPATAHRRPHRRLRHLRRARPHEPLPTLGASPGRSRHPRLASPAHLRHPVELHRLPLPRPTSRGLPICLPQAHAADQLRLRKPPPPGVLPAAQHSVLPRPPRRRGSWNYRVALAATASGSGERRG